MTLKNFLDWAATLPPEFQEAELTSVLYDRPADLKRVVAVQNKESGGLVVAFNPMGTHFKANYFDDNKLVSYYHGPRLPLDERTDTRDETPCPV